MTLKDMNKIAINIGRIQGCAETITLMQRGKYDINDLAMHEVVRILNEISNSLNETIKE